MKLSFRKQPPIRRIYDWEVSENGAITVRDPVKFRAFQQETLRANPGIKWSPYIPITYGPIRYLEIGVHQGENIIDVANSYAKNPMSKIHCVDPWKDYHGYLEYEGKQNEMFDTFNRNTASISDKCVIHRGFSEDIVPTFEDNYFDMIFIDGNHQTEYVYRDGVMSFEKAKSGGYIIFDDYINTSLETIVGIDRFLEEYYERIQIIARPTAVVFWCCSPQVIIRKL